MIKPENIQVIGAEVAIKWSDGSEDFYPMEYLRLHSPSAENVGEKDLLGQQYGGSDQKEYPGVRVQKWEPVGGYAIQFYFSDGHNTGLFGYDYLKKIAPAG
ncbi:MAG: DUF971 domain-containing protein [Verrucomicrobiota bacterium]